MLEDPLVKEQMAQWELKAYVLVDKIPVEQSLRTSQQGCLESLKLRGALKEPGWNPCPPAPCRVMPGNLLSNLSKLIFPSEKLSQADTYLSGLQDMTNAEHLVQCVAYIRCLINESWNDGVSLLSLDFLLPWNVGSEHYTAPSLGHEVGLSRFWILGSWPRTVVL